MKDMTSFTYVNCYADTALSLGFLCASHDGRLKIFQLTSSLVLFKCANMSNGRRYVLNCNTTTAEMIGRARVNGHAAD